MSAPSVGDEKASEEVSSFATAVAHPPPAAPPLVELMESANKTIPAAQDIALPIVRKDDLPNVKMGVDAVDVVGKSNTMEIVTIMAFTSRDSASNNNEEHKNGQATLLMDEGQLDTTEPTKPNMQAEKGHTKSRRAAALAASGLITTRFGRGGRATGRAAGNGVKKAPSKVVPTTTTSISSSATNAHASIEDDDTKPTRRAAATKASARITAAVKLEKLPATSRKLDALLSTSTVEEPSKLATGQGRKPKNRVHPPTQNNPKLIKGDRNGKRKISPDDSSTKRTRVEDMVPLQVQAMINVVDGVLENNAGIDTSNHDGRQYTREAKSVKSKAKTMHVTGFEQSQLTTTTSSSTLSAVAKSKPFVDKSNHADRSKAAIDEQSAHNAKAASASNEKKSAKTVGILVHQLHDTMDANPTETRINAAGPANSLHQKQDAVHVTEGTQNLTSKGSKLDCEISFEHLLSNEQDLIVTAGGNGAKNVVAGQKEATGSDKRDAGASGPALEALASANAGKDVALAPSLDSCKTYKGLTQNTSAQPVRTDCTLYGLSTAKLESEAVVSSPECSSMLELSTECVSLPNSNGELQGETDGKSSMATNSTGTATVSTVSVVMQSDIQAKAEELEERECLPGTPLATAEGTKQTETASSVTSVVFKETPSLEAKKDVPATPTSRGSAGLHISPVKMPFRRTTTYVPVWTYVASCIQKYERESQSKTSVSFSIGQDSTFEPVSCGKAGFDVESALDDSDAENELLQPLALTPNRNKSVVTPDPLSNKSQRFTDEEMADFLSAILLAGDQSADAALPDMPPKFAIDVPDDCHFAGMEQGDLEGHDDFLRHFADMDWDRE